SPTNTYAKNIPNGLQADEPAHPASGSNPAWNGNDFQAVRCAYTVNEAICPRNKFVLGFQGALRACQYVRAGNVRRSAETILATEFNTDPMVVAKFGDNNSGALVSKSHQPVNGFTAYEVGTGIANDEGSLPDMAYGGALAPNAKGYRKVTAA